MKQKKLKKQKNKKQTTKGSLKVYTCIECHGIFCSVQTKKCSRGFEGLIYFFFGCPKKNKK